MLAPPKDVKTLSVDEIKKYIDDVIQDVARQVVASKSNGEETKGQSKQVFATLIVDLSDNPNIANPEFTVFGSNAQEFLKFCFNNCEKWIIYYKQQSDKAAASASAPVSKREFVLRGPAGFVGSFPVGSLPYGLFSPMENGIKIEVRERVAVAPENPSNRQMQPRVSVNDAINKGLIQPRTSHF